MEPIKGWCIQCGQEHDGFYCPKDSNPPKNAAYWKRRALKAEAMYEKAARENTWSFVKRNAMKDALKVIAAYTQQCPTTDSRHMAMIAREALVVQEPDRDREPEADASVQGESEWSLDVRLQQTAQVPPLWR